MNRLAFGLLVVWTVGCGDDGGPVTDLPGGGGSNESSASSGCIEETYPLTPDATTRDGKEAQALLDLLGIEYQADLIWREGKPTLLTVAFSNAQAVRVESREDPDIADDGVRDCEHRVRVNAKLSIVTEDGRFNESLGPIVLELNESGDATAWFHLERDELKGSYVEQTSGEAELTAVYFDLTLGQEVFTGYIFEAFTTGDAMTMGASVGNW